MRWREDGREALKKVGEDDVTGLSAELAYRFLFAIFPLFIFVAALGSFVASALNVENPTDRAMETLGDALPSDAASIVEGELEQVLGEQNAGLLSFGAVLALFAASGAMNALIKAMNRIYDVKESRPFWRKYLVAIGLTVLAGSAVIAGFVVLVVGQVWGQQIAEAIGVEGAFATAVTLLRIPIVLVALAVAVAFLYWAAPNAHLPFRWISPGAVLFVIVWIIATLGFGLYVQNFGNYNATYGALGGVIILMLWFYISALVLLLGAELNAILHRRVAEDEPIRADRDESRRDARSEAAG